eukprot:g65388.t1
MVIGLGVIIYKDCSGFAVKVQRLGIKNKNLLTATYGLLSKRRQAGWEYSDITLEKAEETIKEEGMWYDYEVEVFCTDIRFTVGGGNLHCGKLRAEDQRAIKEQLESLRFPAT